MKLSAVLDRRLDDLVALVNRDGNLPGGRIYRHDLLAVLIALAPETAPELEALITLYFGLRVRDGLVGEDKKSNVIALRPPKPGRRALEP